MKFYRLIVVAVLAMVFCPACKKKEQTPGEKLKEKIDDAFDRRENEGFKDAVEDAQKAAKDARKAATEVVREAKKAAEEATK